MFVQVQNNGYSRCESDRLLEGKVDRRNGHGLISDECLHQTCTNKDDISLLEQYIKELQGRNERLEAVLARKADTDGPVEWYTAELEEGVKPNSAPVYMKDGFGWVNLVGSAYFESTPAPDRPILMLPQGVRPTGPIPIQLDASKNGTGAWRTYGYIMENGLV